MKTKDKGNLAELAVAKEAISKGFSVSFPFGDNERYDLILDTGTELQRVQVRKASEREGYIVFKCYSNHRSDGKIVREQFDRSEIDYFIVWHQEENRLYKVPVEDTPKSEMRLRLNKTDNNQEKKVNWADDYLF